MSPAMLHVHPDADGAPTTLFVAPHAPSPLEAVRALVRDEPAVQRELAERVADWHDEGTDVALDAATRRSGQRGLRPRMPRGVVDLNRGWRGRPEAVETLFGKGALDQWVRANLVPGAEPQLEAWYRSAMAEIRAAAAGVRVLVELHSYGDLGSTYDRNAGGRPMRRSEAAVVHGAPWASAFPVGLARFIPANLRGTPWALEARVGASLADRGIAVGPSPYPTLLPWTISARFLAERWFSWLGRSARLPAGLAAELADLAWTDEQAEVDHPALLDLAAALGAWSHDGAGLADAFAVEDGSATLGVELRIDLRGHAGAFGEAIADAVLC
jgi:hypothetical protein